MRQAHWVVGALLLVPVVFMGWWALRIPPGHGPDEEAHLDYVRLLAKERRFPLLSFSRANPWGEGHQPPLFYGLAALASPVLGIGWRLRAVSLLLGAGTVLTWYHIVRRLLPHAALEAAAIACSASCLPMFCYSFGTVNNGPLVQLLVALALLVGTSPRVWSGPRGLAASGLVAAAILSKYSALFLVPWLVLGWVREVVERSLRLEQLVWLVGRTLLVVLLVSGWWFWRSWLLYGDPFGWHQQMAASSGLVRAERVSPAYLYAVTLELWRSFWAAFGPSARHTAGPSVYVAVSLVSAVGVVGVLSARWGTPRGRVLAAVAGGAVVGLLGWPLAVPWFQGRWPSASWFGLKVAMSLVWGLILAGVVRVRWRPDRGTLTEMASLATAFLLLLMGVYRYNLDFPQPQGRFLLPCAPVVGCGVILGWLSFVGWERRWWVLGGAVGAAVAGNVAGLVSYVS